MSIPLLRRSDPRSWLGPASVATATVFVLFLGWELAERWWLRDHVAREQLFELHIVRGTGIALLIGSLSIYLVLRARRAYDRAFAAAYRELEAAMKARSSALEQSKIFTDHLFDALQDRIIVLDGHGNVVKANRVALEAPGGRSLVGGKCSAFGCACEPFMNDCVAMRAHRLRRPVVGEHLRTDPRTGRIYSVDAYPVPDIDGSGPLVIESAHDVTHAKQLEAHARHHDKLSALGVLAAGIAHDLANPLASLSSELELLEEAGDRCRVQESLGVLRAQVNRMNRTLREMTDFARRRAEEGSLVALQDAVDDALRMLRHDPRARRIAVEVDLSPDLPSIRIVEDHLILVLVNLVLNAFDAMPDGGELKLRARRDAGSVSLKIIDTGAGMSDEVLRRAMEPLFTTKPKGHGTGLGLSICADILRANGGTLTLASVPRSGTTVTVQFGAEAPDA